MAAIKCGATSGASGKRGYRTGKVQVSQSTVVPVPVARRVGTDLRIKSWGYFNAFRVTIDTSSVAH